MGSTAAVGSPARTKKFLQSISALARRWPLSLPVTLFGLGILVYLFTRLVALRAWPIYFFADEAAQTLYAETLVANRFQDVVNHIFLPIYVEADGQRWTPLLSMYIQAVTMTLFGKSLLVTRATSAIVSLLAAISVSLILKQIFKARFWWTGALLVALTPAWLLHSRTAFETVMMTAFYGVFLWLYLLYRQRDARFLYPALVVGAMVFYTYSNAQMIMAVLGLMLLLTDLPYHWQQRRTILRALPLGLLLAMPLLVFLQHRPAAMSTHLRVINSYWTQQLDLPTKIGMFLKNLGLGLSPWYWFWPNEYDWVRHRMAGFGNMETFLLPIFLLGVGIVLWRVRSAPYRVILLAGLAAPSGAAILDIGITRVLAFIVPANILVVIGLEGLAYGIQWLWQRVGRGEGRMASGERRVDSEAATTLRQRFGNASTSSARLSADSDDSTTLREAQGGSDEAAPDPTVAEWLVASLKRIPALLRGGVLYRGGGLYRSGGLYRPPLPTSHSSLPTSSSPLPFLRPWLVDVAIFLFLAAVSLFNFRTALVNGPFWFKDYGMYGMQYGASQLFEEVIPRFLEQDPNLLIGITSTWANGTDRFIRFFLTPAERERVRMDGIGTYLFRKTPIDPNRIFIMTPSEYEQARSSPKFAPPAIEHTVYYPDGSPGFYFVRLRYSEQADAIFAAEKAERSVLKEASVTIDGQAVTVRHSWSDMGEPRFMFDGDRFTLLRGMEANPFIVELDFPAPRAISGLSLDVGAMDSSLTAQLSVSGSDKPMTFQQSYSGVADGQRLELPFAQKVQVTKLRLEILASTAAETVNIHVRELQLLP